MKEIIKTYIEKYFGSILSMLLGASILGMFLSFNDALKKNACMRSWEDSIYSGGVCLVEKNGQYVPEANIILIKWVNVG